MLRVDGKAAGRAQRVEPFSRTGEPIDVGLVVEVAAQYRPAIEPVKAAKTMAKTAIFRMPGC